MTTRLLYELDIHQALNMQEQAMKEMFPNRQINRDYVDFHNHICPRCQKEQKVMNHTVKKMGTVSAFEHPNKEEMILYVSCKECTKEIAKQSRFGASVISSSEKAENTADYILSKIQ